MTLKEFKKLYKYNSGEERAGENFPGVMYYWGDDSNGKFHHCIYKGDEIIESDFMNSGMCCRDRFITVTFGNIAAVDAGKQTITLINRNGEKLLNKEEKFRCGGYLAPGEDEHSEPTHFLIKAGDRRKGTSRVYKVIGDNIEPIKFSGQYASDFSDTGSKFCAIIHIVKNAQQYSDYVMMIGKDYERIPDSYMFDVNGAGPVIGTMKMSKFQPKREEIIIEPKTGKCYPKTPGQITKPDNDNLTGYTYMFTKNNFGPDSIVNVYYINYSNDINYGIHTIGEDYWFTDVFEFEGYGLYILKVKDDDKYYILNGNEIIPCDDFRISGEEQHWLSKLTKNNFIYYEVNGKWRMTQVKRWMDTKEKRPIYDGEFDAVYYLENNVNVIRKGDKEHFVSDDFGLFPADKDGKSYWFDECYPFNGDDEESKDDFFRYIVRIKDRKYQIYGDGSIHDYYD